MPSMAFECFTIDQAAAAANISSRTLKRRLANRSGPAVTKIGRRVVVRSDMLEAWLERCTVAEADASAGAANTYLANELKGAA